MSGKVSTNTQQAVINLDPRTKLYTLMVFSLVMVPSSESELDTILKIVFAGLAFLMLINIRRPGLAAVYAAAYCAAYGANGLLAYISGMSLLGMLKQSNLIILDEATAYADPESEAQIQEAVGRLVHGKTLVVVAHRLSTIQNAEQILVVDKGNIIARGTQKELLEQCPLYHRMWQQYVGASNLEKKEG